MFCSDVRMVFKFDFCFALLRFGSVKRRNQQLRISHKIVADIKHLWQLDEIKDQLLIIIKHFGSNLATAMLSNERGNLLN